MLRPVQPGEPNDINGERCVETVYDFTGPLLGKLPDYQPGLTIRVFGVARRRNVDRGPILTLAVGDWAREGMTLHPIRDVATMMRLADVISAHHSQPINADKLYGPRGRMAGIGRNGDAVDVEQGLQRDHGSAVPV